jgi:peptide-methionine (R)-S-oxide reductase
MARNVQRRERSPVQNNRMSGIVANVARSREWGFSNQRRGRRRSHRWIFSPSNGWDRLGYRSRIGYRDRDRKGAPTMADKVVKTDEEWKAMLTPEQYEVARRKGTERAFTGKYWDFHEQGVFLCVCCGNELFASDTKYDSGCGWPSFYAPLEESRIIKDVDTSYGMRRTEVMCSRCGAHLGHVFDDGPNPTGLRFCMNSASLNFADKKTPDK